MEGLWGVDQKKPKASFLEYSEVPFFINTCSSADLGAKFKVRTPSIDFHRYSNLIHQLAIASNLNY